MSQEVPGFASKSHDIYAIRLDGEDRMTLTHIGILMRTDLGQDIEFLFDNVEIGGAVLIANPVGLPLKKAADVFAALMK